MQFAVETWAPDYGAPVDGAAMAGSEATVDVTVEYAPASWAPVTPATAAAATVFFVDGVQRVDARVWVTDDDGTSTQGVCASWAAGAVRCDGRAQVLSAEVRRGILCAGLADGAIDTRHGIYRAYPVPPASATGADPVGQALGRHRGDLEGRVSAEARGVEDRGAGTGGGAHDDELLVVDGPLGDRRNIPGAVGYVKAHHVSYLPPAQQPVIAALAPGQRTPLFAVGDRRFRWSWYLRLPGPATHAWWGVVRCEASGALGRDEAVRTADRVTATLPPFASRPHNDSRAPQNLHPIAGLERELRRRLGDPVLLERALRRAATDGLFPRREPQAALG